MDIKKYAGYFHDGTLIDIKHRNNNVYFFIESPEIDPGEIKEKSILSPSNTLKGKLSLSDIKNISIGHNKYKGLLEKLYDDGEILDLIVESNKVILLIEWKNFPPKPRVTVVSEIEIEAEKIWWENIPDLHDPF